jgi:hypothetical protein
MATGIPVRADFVVELIRGQGYAVFDLAGKRLTEPTPFHPVADRQRSAFQREADRKAKRGPRACLRCRHAFESEGIHNRMCAPCRLQATADSDAPFSFGAIHGRKRSA